MIAISVISEAIKKQLWSKFSTEAHNESDLVRYINSARRYAVIFRNFPFNKYDYELTTIIWQKKYSIPYQIETFFVLDSSWNEVEIFNFEDYYRQKDKTNKICIFEDKLITEIVWTFTVYYRWFVPTIYSLEWNIDIPEHFFDSMVLAWSYYGYLDVKAFNDANTKKPILDWLLNDLSKRQSDKFPLVTKRLNKSKINTW